MNKKALFVLPLSLLTIACAQPPEQPPMETLGELRIANCVMANVPTKCTPNPGTPEVTVHVAGKAPLGAEPKNRCANPGSDFVFKIVPPTTNASSVAIIPKNPLHTWLIGTNYPDGGKITIHVPAVTALSTDYNYSIVTSDGRCLDPRIHVN